MILQKMHAAEDIVVLLNDDVGWLGTWSGMVAIEDDAGLSFRTKWG